MPNKRKQERLPEGMALVETADGRWFAAFASLVKRAHRGYVLVDPPLIPPALDSFHERGPDYDCREGALAACNAWCEVAELLELLVLLVYWRGLAACTELYPERNAWYLDEIARLAGDDTPRLRRGISVYAVVLAAGIESVEVIAATGNTPDEAIETLYQRVYEWSCHQQAIHAHVSRHPSEQSRRCTGIVSVSSPSPPAFQHPLTLEGHDYEKKQPIYNSQSNLLQLTGVKKLLKVEDVADILGVSRVKVYLLLRNGLPSVKIDGARRFQPDKLQAWIEQHSA